MNEIERWTKEVLKPKVQVVDLEVAIRRRVTENFEIVTEECANLLTEDLWVLGRHPKPQRVENQ